MGEKTKIRIGADGELESVTLDQLEAEYWGKPNPPRFRRLMSFFFTAIGVICVIGVGGVGIAAATGNLNRLWCLVAQCKVAIPTPLPPATVVAFQYTPVFPTKTAVPIVTVAPALALADAPCTSEMLADQREKIAYISDRKAEFGAIRLMLADGTQSCLFLTNEAGITKLTLSADKRSLLYQTSLGWWSVDTNGSNNHAIEPSTGIAQIDANKRSPDGNWLLNDRVEDGISHTYKADSNGNETRLTTFTSRVVEATWSPDGQQIIFVTYRDGNNELYLVNADGTQTRRLTNDLANEHTPVWFK
jgi:hypothetical protein